MTEYEFIPNTSVKEIIDLYIFISRQWRGSQTTDKDKGQGDEADFR